MFCRSAISSPVTLMRAAPFKIEGGLVTSSEFASRLQK